MAITVEKMKKILNNPNLSDKEVELIRDGLQALVKIIFEKWQSEKNIKNKNN